MTSSAENLPSWPFDESEELSLEEVARRQGVKPVTSVEDMAVPGLFEDDAEYEAFLAHLYESRRAGIA